MENSIRVFWNKDTFTGMFSDGSKIPAWNKYTLSATSLLTGWCRVSIFDKDKIKNTKSVILVVQTDF